VSIELATAYVSLVAETTKMEAGIKSAFTSVGKQADTAGKDIGNRIADKASKALRDGWRPDRDLDAGMPKTALDRVGDRIGKVINRGVAGGLRARQLGQDFTKSFSSGAGSVGIGRIVSGWRSDLTGQSNKLGFLAGKAMSAGITAAVGAGVAGVGLALTKGFDRLVALDTANYKLKQILKASGKDTAEADKLSKSIQKSVEGTPFSLDQAFKTAVQAIGAEVTDIERFMTNVADAAGFAGVELDRMGLIFTKVLAKGKLTGEETMQLMEAGLPARSWIEQSYNLTADQFDKMQEKGEITLEMLEKSIQDHAPGMAKALGDTLQGSIDNMQTAIARVGANFLAAVFGGDSGDPTEGMKDAVQRLTDLLKQLDAWIVANRDEIRAFFTSAADAAGTLLGVLGSVANVLKEHPGLIQAVVTAFVAWKSIQGVTAVLTAVTSINTGLRAMPGLAGAALGPIGALTSALLAAGTAAYFLGTAGDSPFPGVSTPTDPTGERGLQNRRTGTSIMGVPSAVDAPIFGGGGLLGGGGSFGGGQGIGGAGAGGGGGVPGTAGKGFMNPQAVNDYLDNLAAQGTSIGAAGQMLTPGDFSSVQAAGSKFGLAMTSGYRPPTGPAIAGVSAATSYHGSGRAQDYAGTPEQMLAFANYMADTYGPQLKELIFDHPNFTRNINNGRAVGPFGQYYTLDQAGVHSDHVHVAFDEGGWLQPGTRLVTNDTGKPELVLNPEQQDRLSDMGVDPNTLLHGTGNAAPPGPQQQQGKDYGSDFVRSLGFIPANAGNTSVAGTSSLAGFINMGNDVVGGLIDTGASLAQMAVQAGMEFFGVHPEPDPVDFFFIHPKFPDGPSCEITDG